MKYFCLLISNILLIVYILYYLKYRKEIKQIEKKLVISNNYIMGILSPFFYYVMNNFDKLSKLNSEKLKISIKNLYGENLFRYYENLILSKKLFLVYIYNILFFILLSIKTNLIIFIFGLIFSVLLAFYIDFTIINLYKKEVYEIKRDLPNFLSRLELFLLAGLSLRTSIDIIINFTSGKITEKLIIVKEYINNGKSEEEAYNIVLNKNEDILTRKFISIIIQNLKKGNEGTEDALQLIKKEANDFRKAQIIIKTQESSRKLLFPNILIFTGIMLIVMIPMLFEAF